MFTDEVKFGSFFHVTMSHVIDFLPHCLTPSWSDRQPNEMHHWLGQQCFYAAFLARSLLKKRFFFKISMRLVYIKLQISLL